MLKDNHMMSMMTTGEKKNEVSCIFAKKTIAFDVSHHHL